MYRLIADLVRRCGAEQRELLAANNTDLLPVLDALNCVSAIPWTVNEKVLDVAIELFRKGGDTSLDIPLHYSKFPNPQKITA